MACLSTRDKVVEEIKKNLKPCAAAVVYVIAISMINSIVVMDAPLLLLSGIGMSLYALMVLFWNQINKNAINTY